MIVDFLNTVGNTAVHFFAVIYSAGQKFPDTWILFNFLIKTPIIISKKFKYYIYFIKDTYSYYLRKKKDKK